jgi:hypothetical protein
MICGNKRIEMTQKWVPKEELNYSGRRIWNLMILLTYFLTYCQINNNKCFLIGPNDVLI